jgi:anti-sigma-K factor RskA
MRGRRVQLHTLVGAYVMDALPEGERADFERHLGGCEQCRDDVRGLREATSALSCAVAAAPPAAMRDRTLLGAVRLRQLPPVLPGEQPHGHAKQDRRPASARLSRPASARLAGLVPRGWRARGIAAVTAAVLVAAAVLLGLHISSMQDGLSLAEQRDHDIAVVLTAPDATEHTAKVSTGGTATVVMSHRVRALVIMTHGLAALPPSQGYEVWLMNSAGDRPAGMLPPPRAGMTDPMVVSRLRPGDMLGLTVEPSAGTRQPTSLPIVLVSLGS